MATVNKNFRIKDGLIVEGTTGTINGYDIFTAANTTDDIAEGTTNLFFTAQRAADAVADEISTAVVNAVNALTTSDIEEGTNLYFTAQRAVDAGDGVFDAYGAASTAQSNANSYTDTAIGGLSTVYDALGAAATAEGNANDYTDSAISGLSTVYDAAGAAATAQANAEDYADSLAGNYDAAGAAATAEGNANDYTDSAILTEVTNRNNAIDSAISTEVTNRNNAIATAKGEANDYTDTAVANLVDGAPALLDTLNELAAALQDNPDVIANIQDVAAGKQDTLTAGTGIDITGATISVASNTYDAYGSAATAEGNANDYTDSSIAGLSTVYDALGAAATAETNANDYADATFVTLASLPGQLDDYVPTSEKGAALGVATLDADGQVPANQLGNVPDNYITSVGDNLSVSTGGMTPGGYVPGGLLSLASEPTLSAIDFGTPGSSIFAKVTANKVSVSASGSADVYADAAAGLNGFEAVVKAKTTSGTSGLEITKLMILVDESNNVYITEYANMATGVDLFNIAVTSQSWYGGTQRLHINVESISQALDATVVVTALA